MLDVVDVLASLGDPTALARSIPDSMVWPHYLALMLRAYLLPVFTYWVGMGLLVLGALLSVYQYMVGAHSLKDALLKIGIPALLWPFVVVSPSQVGCDPQYKTYPCVLKGDWQARKIDMGTLTVQTYELDPTNPGQLVPVPVAINARPMVQISFNPNPGPGYSNDSHFGRLLKGLWGSNARIANQALYVELARLQNQVRGYKKQLVSLITYSSLIVGGGGAASVALNAVSFLPVGGVVGFGLGLLAGFAEASVDAIAQITSTVTGSVATVMLYAPLVLLSTFHTLILLSGALLYFLLFLSPIILGLATVQGTAVLQGPFKLLLLSVLFPLFVGPIFAASLKMAYGNVVSERQKQLEKIEGILETMMTQKDATYSVRYSIGTGVMIQQLLNAKYCLDGRRDIPVKCPSKVVVERPGDIGPILVELQRMTRGSFWAPENVATYPAIFVGDEQAVRKGLKFLDQKSALDILGSQADFDALMGLIKKAPPFFVWNWKGYVEEMGKSQQGSEGSVGALINKLKEDLKSGHTADDFRCDVIDKPLNQLSQLAGLPSGAPGDMRRKFLVLYGADSNMKNLMGPYPSIPAQRNQGAPSCPSGSPFLKLDTAYTVGGIRVQPYHFYGFLDFGYLSMRLANRLPGEMASSMRTTSAALFVSTLVGFLGAILLATTAWSLLSTLISAGHGEGVGSALGGIQSAGFLALGTAVLSANIAQSAQRTTSAADQAVLEEGRRISQSRVVRATAQPPTVSSQRSSPPPSSSGGSA